MASNGNDAMATPTHDSMDPPHAGPRPRLNASVADVANPEPTEGGIWIDVANDLKEQNGWVMGGCNEL